MCSTGTCISKSTEGEQQNSDKCNAACSNKSHIFMTEYVRTQLVHFLLKLFCQTHDLFCEIIIVYENRMKKCIVNINDNV